MSIRAVTPLLRGGVFGFAVVVAALLAGTGSARVSAVASCGTTITSNTTLATDLRCPGAGLIVSGDGVTLDLAGHVVRGSATGVGIAITGSHVTVRNGTVRGFQEGVHVAAPFDGGDSHLVLLSVIRNELGVVLASPLGRIDASSISENVGDGVRANGSNDWSIENSAMSRNGGDGLSAIFARNVSVASNAITANDGNGIEFGVHVDVSRVTGNLVAGNAAVGIKVSNSTIRVIGNTVRSNGSTGISLFEGEGGLDFARFYEVTGNVSSKNGGAGITACVRVPGSECAPGMVDGGGNVARFNGVTPECVNVVCSPRN